MNKELLYKEIETIKAESTRRILYEGFIQDYYPEAYEAIRCHN